MCSWTLYTDLINYWTELSENGCKWTLHFLLEWIKVTDRKPAFWSSCIVSNPTPNNLMTYYQHYLLGMSIGCKQSYSLYCLWKAVIRNIRACHNLYSWMHFFCVVWSANSWLQLFCDDYKIGNLLIYIYTSNALHIQNKCLLLLETYLC